jgi:hypothetical protein
VRRRNYASERKKQKDSGVGPNGRPLLDLLLLNAKKAGYKTSTIIVENRRFIQRVLRM